MLIIDKKQQMRQIIIGVVVAILVYSGLSYLRYISSEILAKRNINLLVEMLAESMNNQCPYYDDEVVLEKVSFVKEKTLIQEYVMLHSSKDDFDLQQLEKKIIEGFIEGMDSENFAVLRNNDVIFKYIIYDNQRKEIFRFRLLLNTPITVIY